MEAAAKSAVAIRLRLEKLELLAATQIKGLEKAGTTYILEAQTQRLELLEAQIQRLELL